MSRQRFEKSRRLGKNREFQKVYTQGQKKSWNLFALQWLKVSGQQETRIGLCVGRKIGNAVVRNRIKRRLREAIRTYPQALPPGHWLVINVKKEAVASESESLKICLYLAIEEVLGIK